MFFPIDNMTLMPLWGGFCEYSANTKDVVLG